MTSVERRECKFHLRRRWHSYQERTNKWRYRLGWDFFSSHLIRHDWRQFNDDKMLRFYCCRQWEGRFMSSLACQFFRTFPRAISRLHLIIKKLWFWYGQRVMPAEKWVPTVGSGSFCAELRCCFFFSRRKKNTKMTASWRSKVWYYKKFTFHTKRMNSRIYANRPFLSILRRIYVPNKTPFYFVKKLRGPFFPIHLHSRCYYSKKKIFIIFLSKAMVSIWMSRKRWK